MSRPHWDKLVLHITLDEWDDLGVWDAMEDLPENIFPNYDQCRLEITIPLDAVSKFPPIFRNVVYLETCDAPGFRGAGWYFWDETWAHLYGTYLSGEEAQMALELYCREELNG